MIRPRHVAQQLQHSTPSCTRSSTLFILSSAPPNGCGEGAVLQLWSVCVFTRQAWALQRARCLPTSPCQSWSGKREHKC